MPLSGFLQPTCCQRAPTGSFESRVPSLRPSIAHFHRRIPVIHAFAQRRHDCFHERAGQPQATRQPRGDAVIGGPTSTVALFPPHPKNERHQRRNLRRPFQLNSRPAGSAYKHPLSPLLPHRASSLLPKRPRIPFHSLTPMMLLPEIRGTVHR